MLILPKVIYTVNVISIKIPMIFFADKEKPILKHIWNLQRPQIDKTILKRTKLKDSNILISKIYYKVTSMKIVWYWHKDRHTDQWNRIQNPEGNL